MNQLSLLLLVVAASFWSGAAALHQDNNGQQILLDEPVHRKPARDVYQVRDGWVTKLTLHQYGV